MPPPRDEPSLEPVRWNVQPPGTSYRLGRLKHRSTNSSTVYLQYISYTVYSSTEDVNEHYYAWPSYAFLRYYTQNANRSTHNKIAIRE